MRKQCVKCRRQFRPQKGATHRRYCFTCRPARPAEESSVVPIRPDDGAEESALVVATRLELGVRAESADGLVCLTVAEQIAKGGHTASGLAALQRAFREAKAAALQGVEADDVGSAALRELFGS